MTGDATPTTPERPAWVPDALYPFADRWVEIDGHTVHYVDEGTGPTLLMLHGNPTWSFLYRDVIAGLCDSFRCVAPDYPGFGLSRPAPGYGFTPLEHSLVIERLVERLELGDVTLMVQDWGGPIGFGVATRRPERFSAFVIGNTWAWPKVDPPTRAYAWALGGPVGRRLVASRNLFVEKLLPAGMLRAQLGEEAMIAYRGPFPTRGSRVPTAVFAREITGSLAYLAEVERGLGRLRDRRALIVWPTGDVAFRAPERRRFEQVFPDHKTVLLEGAGHFFQEDAAEEVVSAIRAWSAGRGGYPDAAPAEDRTA